MRKNTGGVQQCKTRSNLNFLVHVYERVFYSAPAFPARTVYGIVAVESLIFNLSYDSGPVKLSSSGVLIFGKTPVDVYQCSTRLW